MRYSNGRLGVDASLGIVYAVLGVVYALKQGSGWCMHRSCMDCGRTVVAMEYRKVVARKYRKVVAREYGKEIDAGCISHGINAASIHGLRY